MTTHSATPGRAGPATPVEWDAGLGVFVVTGFDEASAVLRGTGWSSDPSLSPLTPPELADMPRGLMLFSDPPDHTRVRRLIAPVFSARAIEGLRPRVAAIAEACLDELDGFGANDPLDLLTEYAYVLPMAVMAELLDVGVEGAQVFLSQTPHLVRMLEVGAGPDAVAAAVAASFEVTMFLTPILSQRRGGSAGEDFISALLACADLTLDEVLATCILLLAAGHETTANLIGNGALAILRDPAQLPLLEADPARAVEELLRREGPVTLIARTALTDHEVGAVTVRAGQQVLLRIDLAGRDERRWPDATRLDLGREGPSHLGFGTGIHFCLGAALARMEAAEALTRLFARYPDLRLAEPDDEPRWRDSTTFHGLEELPVRLR